MKQQEESFCYTTIQMHKKYTAKTKFKHVFQKRRPGQGQGQEQGQDRGRYQDRSQDQSKCQDRCQDQGHGQDQVKDLHQGQDQGQDQRTRVGARARGTPIWIVYGLCMRSV